MREGMAHLALSLALLALVAWLWARHLRGRSGLPCGRVLYADTGVWRRPAQPLFSTQYGLTGKPDYLVEESGSLIPVEVKSGFCPSTLYSSHRLQLAAYCLLVEEACGQAPPYGILRYRDEAVAVDYTPALRDALLTTLQAMRQDHAAEWVPRRHDHAARCRACGFHRHCVEALA